MAVEKGAIKSAIYEHPEFAAYIDRMNAHFKAWRTRAAEQLKALTSGFHPKELIASLSEDLLAHYTGQPLIDPYAVYQHLMDYWAETMQDDCYLIAADGWKAATYRVTETRKGKDGKPGKVVDKGWACDLIPKALVVARYFAAEQAALDRLSLEVESAAASRAELEEEHGGEEGVFAEFDRITAAAVKARLKELNGLFTSEDEAEEEAGILRQWLRLADAEADFRKRWRDTENNLDQLAYEQYTRLPPAEIQALVVDDKWLRALDTAVYSDLDRISRCLAIRVTDLAVRYELPLPCIALEVARFEDRVNRHFERMGFTWA